ncbi:NUDIX domain-containing protein [Streptomyces sp. NPDC059352]|uniref:NUDIX domain-containing protein n=1 Tax=Streptomyces sp. NPDC059352 TaxID=3346810 RepID=UPI00368F7C21
MTRRTGSTVVYTNPWMRLLEDTVVHASGAPGLYAYVDKPDFALIIPRSATGFWLVEEFRYPVGGRRWSFPQGSWPEGGSGDATALARAELAEETGLSAGRLHPLGRLEIAPGMSNQGMHVFLAEELVPGTPHREATESDMIHRHFTADEFRALVAAGELVNAASLAALALYQNGRAASGEDGSGTAGRATDNRGTDA